MPARSAARTPRPSPDDASGAPAPPHLRRQVTAWSLWDWGGAAFNAVVTTFVFTPWLTSDTFVEAGKDVDAVTARHSAWLGWGLTVAGVLIAVLAPALGALADRSGRRKLWLGANSAVVFVTMLALWFVEPVPGHLSRAVVLGVVLLSVGNVFYELAGVAYNALLLQISTPRTIGRISGIGWGAGYVGGIVLLLILFVGFINPDVGWFGVTDDHGLDFRVSMVIAALWFGIFAIPVLVVVQERRKPPFTGGVSEPAAAETAATGHGARRARGLGAVAAAYRQLFRDLARLWRTSRSTLGFLVASAVFRDGLAGVFTFGAVIASGTFGFSSSEVIVFAIAANVVAGICTVSAGWLDDRIGPRRVVIGSLVGLVVAGTAVFVLHDGGQTPFWIFGLLLSAFVGPAQSASRALLGRLAEPGRETEIFGLYATTGRAASFLAPFAFSTLVSLTGHQYWGILGIVAVLVLGLVLLLLVRLPRGRGIGGLRDVDSAGATA
ncbi:MFS transporter [Luteimicrobium xylanilyticum]|uniref:Putative MFS-type transporter YxiO n=1 Tax=Luteimicrobium xylanilyticum TaxID=1133546 RepID=A0A5P9QAA2_9MICO|nr:MFS transporter [Luteimicrobium xylanilyticum]QFU98354.1 putative MFS-type transporter YxiO [Luteimicrobium xylanilyticum]